MLQAPDGVVPLEEFAIRVERSRQGPVPVEVDDDSVADTGPGADGITDCLRGGLVTLLAA